MFGLDPVADPVGVLSRIGYLSEEPDMPGWMRVHELMRYIAAFYPTWDHDYAEQLRREFDLDPAAKVKQLSKGQRARAGLLIALAYRPELLLLDEPSSGLDPIVRRDILGAIIRTIADEGRTVLFSSHLLGRSRARVRPGGDDQVGPHSVLRFARSDQANARPADAAILPSPQAKPPSLAGALAWDGSGCEWTAVCTGRVEPISQSAAAADRRTNRRTIGGLARRNLHRRSGGKAARARELAMSSAIDSHVAATLRDASASFGETRVRIVAALAWEFWSANRRGWLVVLGGDGLLCAPLPRVCRAASTIPKGCDFLAACPW